MQYLEATANKDRHIRGPLLPREVVPGCRHFVWTTESGRYEPPGGYELYVRNGVLIYIKIAPYEGPRATKQTIGDVVARYGEPSLLSSELAIGPDGQFYTQEVYYPQLGLAFRLYADQKKVGQLQPNAEVLWSEYVAPGDLTQLLTARNVCLFEHAGVVRERIQGESESVRPWTGFGPVEVVVGR
ncbi:MAG: hypothetical protein ACYC4L_09870 [Chloroflexota bacterium]